jgi:hypothetical protein
MFLYVYAVLSVCIGVLSTIGIDPKDLGKVGITERLFLFVFVSLLWPIFLLVCLWWVFKPKQ